MAYVFSYDRERISGKIIMHKVKKKDLKNIITIIIFATVLIFGIRYLYLHWQEFAVMLKIPFRLLLPILLCSAGSIISGYWFIKMSMKYLKVDLNITEWMGIPACSNVIGIFVPFHSELILRGVYYKKRCSVAYSKFIGLSIGGSLIMLIVYYIDLVACLWKIGISSSNQNLCRIVIILVIVLFVGLSLLVVMVKNRSWFYNFKWIEKYMKPIIEGTADIISSRSIVGWCIVTVLISNFFGIIRIWLVTRALNMTSTIAAATLYYCIYQGMSLVTIVPGNVGITESMMGLAADAIGGLFQHGVMISLTSRISEMLVYIVISILFLAPVLKAVRGSKAISGSD